MRAAGYVAATAIVALVVLGVISFGYTGNLWFLAPAFLVCIVLAAG